MAERTDTLIMKVSFLNRSEEGIGTQELTWDPSEPYSRFLERVLLAFAQAGYQAGQDLGNELEKSDDFK